MNVDIGYAVVENRGCRVAGRQKEDFCKAANGYAVAGKRRRGVAEREKGSFQ